MSDSFSDNLTPPQTRTDAIPSRTPADVLFLPDADRSLVNWLLRQQSATLAEIAAQTEQSREAAQTQLNELVAQGYLKASEQAGEIHYQPCLHSRKGRQVSKNIWDALS